MFCVLAAPLEGALDAGRALATLAKERSQGFIDAEPYNTRTWNGVWIIPHLHVDGRVAAPRQPPPPRLHDHRRV